MDRQNTYSASLKLASLDSLTENRHPLSPSSRFNPAPLSPSSLPSSLESSGNHHPAISSHSLITSAANSPSSAASAAIAANPALSLLASMPGSPLSAMLAAGNLPKPSDLIQQAQALQLLAHLQTVLLNPQGAPAANTAVSEQHNLSSLMSTTQSSIPKVSISFP